VFLIAPECGGVLERCSRVVTLAGGELLTPSGEFLRLGSDKNAAAACWEAAGVPTAIGVPLTAGELLPANFSYPAVLKPADGAGSAGVRLVPSWAPGLVVPNDSPRWRLEQHMPGRAASVLMLARDGQRVCFPPSWQHLSDDGRFTYQGGSTPIPAALAIRAETLAHAAAAALPPTNGLFGFDLVLNDAWPGDVVIEVNPRLTTSYLGVRRLVVDNPLAALLSRRVPAAWRVAPDVTARAPIVFAADDIFAA
jgi:predicted ATP-grasp superfamily ATP-dependent carboligase